MQLRPRPRQWRRPASQKRRSRRPQCSKLCLSLDAGAGCTPHTPHQPNSSWRPWTRRQRTCVALAREGILITDRDIRIRPKGARYRAPLHFCQFLTGRNLNPPAGGSAWRSTELLGFEYTAGGAFHFCPLLTWKESHPAFGG